MIDLNEKNRRAYFKSRYKRDYVLLVEVLLAAVLITFCIFAAMRALDLWAINTCVQFNDCHLIK